MNINGKSDRGQSRTDDTITVSMHSIDGARGGGVPIAASPQVPSVQWNAIKDGAKYGAPMTTSANSVIAAIDARRPGLKLAKKYSLLFFVQGHHIAHFGSPLFDEPITATDRGVSVPDADGSPAEQPDGEGPLNTIGYVIERYGALSPADLRTLIQSSQPWQAATKPGGGGRIDPDILRDWFRRDDETNDPDDERPNRAERAQAEGLWKTHKAQQAS